MASDGGWIVRSGTAFLGVALAVAMPRLAAADAIYDLRIEGSSAVINGATYLTDTTQPLGTGHNQFLGVQGPTSQPQTEGYNTDPNSNMEFDTQPGTNTDPLALSSLQLLADGTYGFLLDIDQTGADSFLSLDRLEIYLGNAPDLTGFASSGSTANTATYGSQTTGFDTNSVLIYNLDAAPDGPAAVLLDFDNGITGPGGSGIGDMLLRVDADLFAPYAEDFPWVYLYSRFGDTAECQPGVADGTCVQNGGPERWHAITGENETGTTGGSTTEGSTGGGTEGTTGGEVPEPASLILLGSGLVAAAARVRRSR